VCLASIVVVGVASSLVRSPLACPSNIQITARRMPALHFMLSSHTAAAGGERPARLHALVPC
jgi:hypothetical protein